MCRASVIFSSSEANATHRHWKLGLSPALVCQWTPNNLRESLSSDAIELAKERF